MKQLLWFLVPGALALASTAAAYDLAQNGGFETASLTGWQTFNQGASGGQGSWYANNGSNGTYSGLPTSPPPAGGWQAAADNSGRAAAILYQDITLPATTHAVLSFVVWHGNAAVSYVNGSSLSPASTNQRVRVDIIDTGTNLLTTSSGVLRVVYATAPGSPAIVQPTTITTDLTAYAGQTVRLRVALVATNGGLIAGLDQVRLEVSPFAPHANPVQGLYTGPARWGDFDGDGDFEFAQMGGDDFDMFWNIVWWQPIGSFWFPYTTLAGMAHGGIALGDFDRDGDLDLGGAGWTHTRVHDLVVYRNNGGSTNFESIPQSNIFGFLEPGTTYGSFDWGDYDNDGDLDALFSGTAQGLFGESPATLVGVNDGAGTLSLTAPLGLPGVTGGNAVWNDLTGNGNLDVAQCGSNLAGVFAADGSGGFIAFPTGSVPQVTDGAVAMGDLDNDGYEDLVVTGMSAGVPVARVYRYDWGNDNWTELPAGLTGVSKSAVSLGDFDNDGWLDIATCGLASSGAALTLVYHNNGNGTFTNIAAALPGVSRGSVEFGDFDGDGDLDLLLQGHDGTNKFTGVFRNSIPTANADPTPPLGPTEWTLPTEVLLTFAAYGSDDHTPSDRLSSNFRVGTSPGASDIVAPMSNLVSGRRLVPRPGEARFSAMRTLSLLGFGHGPLYWSVQSVDQAYRGSAWAPEHVYSVGPHITQVQDVPGDQGGKVRVTLDKSVLDDTYRTDFPAAGYNVWRLVPAGPLALSIARAGTTLDAAVASARLMGRTGSAAAGATPAATPVVAGADRTDLPLIEWSGRLFTRSPGPALGGAFPAGTWEIVGSFFALQQATYTVVTNTLADSGAAGPNDATFIVSVHSTTPAIWFAGPPASGRSVDNLAPAAPVGLAAAHHTGNGNHLTWQPAPEPDFAAFRIYRGNSPGFVAGPATLAATVANPAWTDPGYDAPVVFYRVSTLDHAGNESPAVAPGQVTSTDGPALPVVFALRPASPNPFGASTRIGFALPQAADVRLDVFDPAGRLVRTVLDRPLPPGEHEATWTGEDREGKRVNVGVYFYRLQAGAFSASRRVVLMP